MKGFQRGILRQVMSFFPPPHPRGSYDRRELVLTPLFSSPLLDTSFIQYLQCLRFLKIETGNPTAFSPLPNFLCYAPLLLFFLLFKSSITPRYFSLREERLPWFSFQLYPGRWKFSEHLFLLVDSPRQDPTAVHGRSPIRTAFSPFWFFSFLYSLVWTRFNAVFS